MYFTIIENEMNKILSKDYKQNITYDILDFCDNKLIILKEKQKQMRIGEIWQIVLGNYKSFRNLKIGHESGLDLISYEKKIVIELKNRTNTDNYSSKKSNFDKLVKFKKDNPDYRCIYGCINEKTEEKTLNGKEQIIFHNNEQIEIITGYKLLTLILENNVDEIINFVKTYLNNF
jgi:hypothetical protein